MSLQVIDPLIKKHLTDMEAQEVFNCLTEFNAGLHDESMRDDGLSNEKVSQYSGLSLEEVQKLAKGK